MVLKGELKGKRKETRSVALSAGEACNYEPLDRQLAYISPVSPLYLP